MTHDELAVEAGRWLKSRHGCGAILTNCRNVITSELPDAIGWMSYGWSVLVEVKMSRADFTRDLKKSHRSRGAGMGQERWYMTPPGLLRASEIPERWGLVELRNGRFYAVKLAQGTRQFRARAAREALVAGRTRETAMDQYLSQDRKEISLLEFPLLVHALRVQQREVA